MVTPELLEFIKKQTNAGVPREDILASLRRNKWSEADLDEALNRLKSENALHPLPQAPVQVTPPKTISPQVSTMPARAPKHSHKWIFVLGIVLVLAALAWLGWERGFFQRMMEPKAEPISENNEVPAVPKMYDFNELRVSLITVPENENSASIFNKLPKDSISKADRDFITTYIIEDSIVLPPFEQSKNILSKYSALLAGFEAGTNKNFYQCSSFIDKMCEKNVLRDVAHLGALKAFVLSKEGKTQEAEDYAKRVIKLGRMVSASTDDTLDYMVGLDGQKTGYTILKKIRKNDMVFPEDKALLVKTLREENKKVHKFSVKGVFELIDYISNETKKPRNWITNYEGIAERYRPLKTDVTWDPEETKNYFYQSLLIDLANIDLDCQSNSQSNVVDVGEFSRNEQEVQKIKNSIGKNFYKELSLSGDEIRSYRCAVEALINSL